MESPGGSVVKNLPAMLETQVQFLGQEDSQEKEMATYSCILVWEILWQRSLAGSMGFLKKWVNLATKQQYLYVYICTYIPVF